CRVRDRAIRHQLWQPVARDALNPPRGVAIEYPAAADEPRTQRALDRLEDAKQAVDRASRSALARAVDANGEQMLIAPITGTHERQAVRLPLPEKTIDLDKQSVGVAAGQSTIAPEDPDARHVRQRLEWHDRHRFKDNARATTDLSGPGE